MQFILLKIRNISLTQFKNYHSRSIGFEKRIIGICGNNGVGKTNLLDAIHYLCFTKSHFSRFDQGNSLIGFNGFRIEAEIDLENKNENAVCILRETGKKEFHLDAIPYEKFSHHIGRYPCVMIAPDDVQIITGESEDRRKWLDTLLSQLDKTYLTHLLQYNRLLQQRNSLLKNFAESATTDFTLLDVLDEQLVTQANFIFEKRKLFFNEFIPLLKNNYYRITSVNEAIELKYESELLSSSFIDLVKWNRLNDLSAQRTTVGIHRDELIFKLQNQPFKKFASQGQRKSLLFAIKLTELDLLKEKNDFSPLLLLDDVFEKLDENRIMSLLKTVCIENQGQVFITDTNNDRLSTHLNYLQLDFEIINL